MDFFLSVVTTKGKDSIYAAWYGIFEGQIKHFIFFKCLDLIAVPDVLAGAMENWGLMTFRENLLLFDPKSGSAADKQYVAIVVAHELAHQVLKILRQTEISFSGKSQNSSQPTKNVELGKKVGRNIVKTPSLLYHRI